MKQIDIIFNELQMYYDENEFIKAINNKSSYGLNASEIADKLDIARNNASANLNKLVNEGKIVKLTGRPVRFLPRHLLETTLKVTLEKNEYTIDKLKLLLISSQDPFMNLVGHDGTLKASIDQAKAAIMYPPNGLNTMVVAKPGTGVTSFVKAMYQFARIQKDYSEEEYPFAYINCADYKNSRQISYHIFGTKKMCDESTGLLEEGNGGVLFIDNGFLLSNDIQERLFHFLDKGEYCKIGDDENVYKSKVLLILATSLDHSHMLDDALLRRIPIKINLPELAEWRADERVKLIEHFFSIEASRTNKVIKITSEVVRALTIYDCIGNLSQFEADIKKICAKAFLEQLHQDNVLNIEFSNLPANIKDYVISGKIIDSRYREYLKAFDNNLIIDTTKESKVNVLAQNTIYAKILNISEKMHKQGKKHEEIDIVIKKCVDDYINNYLASYSDYRSIQKELYRSLNPEIVDFTILVAEEAAKELQRNVNSNLICVLAFHINYLILRSKAKSSENDNEYPYGVDIDSKEYQVAKKITRKISKHFETDIKDQEIGFIALLLQNRNITNTENMASVLIVAHGDKTATSMANVANQLMKTNIVYGLDMPLDLSPDDIYIGVLSIVNAIKNDAGILLMVDMGSLASVGKRVAEETGIVIRNIERVSTLYVLEAVRRIIYKKETLDDIQKGIMELQTLPYYVDGETYKKPLCIITTCSTGIGTSIMLQKKIEEKLVDKKISSIKVIPVGYSDIKSNSSEFENIKIKYEIIACAGNINPKISDTFFDLINIVRETKNNSFDEFINSYVDICRSDPFVELESILNDNVYYFNVKKLLPSFKSFFDIVGNYGYTLSNDAIIKCSLHISYMLERLILKQMAIFSDKKDSYIKENQELYDSLSESLKPFEKVLNVSITSDEICFLCEVFNNIDRI